MRRLPEGSMPMAESTAQSSATPCSRVLETSVKEEIAEAAEGAVPPGFELVIEQSRGPADLGRGQALDAEFGQHLLDGARGDALHIHLGGA